MLRALGLGAAVALASASAAAAAPLFETYQTVCVETRADSSASIQAADRLGWMPLPDPMVAQLQSQTGMRDAKGRMVSTTGGLMFMMVGQRSMPVSGQAMNMTACAVAQMPAPAGADLKSQVAQWVAVAPDERLTDKNSTAYVFTEEGGVRRKVDKPTDDKAKALLTARAINFVFIRSDAQMAMLAFAVPSM
jgi:hypothetical protein